VTRRAMFPHAGDDDVRECQGAQQVYAQTYAAGESPAGRSDRTQSQMRAPKAGLGAAKEPPSEPASVARGPWLSVVDAARHAGWRCPNDRAPASFYELAKRIGVKINGKWRVHVDDLDAELRLHAVSR
jgi:hypothetical protein